MPTNLQIKSVKGLHLKKNREKEGKFICEGRKIVKELLEEKPEIIEQIFYTENSILDINSAILSEQISAKAMSQLSALKTASDILAVCKIQETQIEKLDKKLYLYLDKISDPGNLGTIIRSCDWYGIDTLFISPESVDIYNPKVIQSTMASFFRINCVITELSTIVDKFPDISIYGADMDGTSIYEKSIVTTSILVMGSESHGISQESQKIIQENISIPRIGKAESLNVAVASSIILSHFMK